MAQAGASAQAGTRARSGTTAAANNGGWEVDGVANGGNGPAARTCKAKAQAETGVQARAVEARACRAMALAVAVTAVAEAEKLRATTGMAQSFDREGEYELTK